MSSPARTGGVELRPNGRLLALVPDPNANPNAPGGIANTPAPTPQPTNPYRPNVGGMPTPGGGGAPAAQVDPEAYKDPVLGESIVDDWEFTLLIAVVVDPPPATPASAPAPGSSASAQ